MKVQRAFVFVSKFDIGYRTGEENFGEPKDSKYLWFVPIIGNSGNTPTKNMRYLPIAFAPALPNPLGIGPGQIAEFDITVPRGMEPGDPRDVWNGKSRSGEINPRAGLIGPKAEFAIGGVGFTEDFVTAIKSGVPFYMYGMIEYNDVFRDSPLHVTKFCYQISLSTSDKGEMLSTYGLCKHWNCADEECKTDREAYDAEVAEAGKVHPSQPQ